MAYKYDVFISHASEDKPDCVEPLVRALEERQLRVWYDHHEIELGDDFRRKMEEGLAQSAYGVIVLSPNFRKYWSEAELSAFLAHEALFDTKRILPVLHRLDRQGAALIWPFLAARSSVRWSEGVRTVVERICAVLERRPAPPRKTITRLYGDLPPASTRFVGREAELAQLAQLLAGESVSLSASIDGLAGIGKTELARQLVDQLALKGSFPGGIFWLPSENPDLTSVWGSTIADGLGLPAAPVAERAQWVLQDLRGRTEPVLLVFDNVEQWGSGGPLPQPEGVQISRLLTTRERGLGGSAFRHVPLGFLEPAAARQLLLATAGEAVSHKPGLDALLAYLDGHSLAVELAGAFLDLFPGETPASYLEELRAGSLAEDETEAASLIRYQSTVHEALRTMWERSDEALRSAWLLAAQFAPDLVAPDFASEVGLSRGAQSRLRRAHLIDADEKGSWSMHRLVRAFAQRSETSQGLKAQALEAFVRGCAKLANRFDPAEAFRPYLRHRFHLDLAAENYQVLPPESASRFMNQIGIARHSAGDFAGAREQQEQALALSLEHLGEHHPDVANWRGNLGLVLRDQGDLAGSREQLEQALGLSLECLGEHHPHVAIWRGNLGLVLKDQGDLAGAREQLEQALELSLEHLGVRHPHVATWRGSLGLVLHSQGDLAGACEQLEQALALSLEHLGEHHPSVAITRGNLGLVLQSQGDLVGAREQLEQALKLSLEHLGEYHPSVATWRGNLGLVLQSQGDLVGAREQLEQALELTLEHLGERHPSVATWRGNLGLVLRDQWDLAGARELLASAIVGLEAKVLDTHPNLLEFRQALKTLGGDR